MPAGIHSTQFPILNKQKMGTSICDVAVTLKQQEKMETSFFLNRIHFPTKNMFETLNQKCTRVTLGPTLTHVFFSFTIIIANIIYRYSSDDISPKC